MRAVIQAPNATALDLTKESLRKRSCNTAVRWQTGRLIMNKLLKRMLGAARLNADTYEQVEADRTSLTGAVFTAVIASVAAAIGTGARDVVSVVSATSVLLMTWIVWVVLTYVIGTRL